jgi:hypothetical protein
MAMNRRFSLNMLTAVSFKGECRFLKYDSTVKASAFKAFLQCLIVSANQPVFVVLDVYPVHKFAMVLQYIESQTGQLQFYFLFPYLLQFNLNEQVYSRMLSGVSAVSSLNPRMR